ncbi:phosphatase, partial [Stenotrophomonas maltophilia]|nr:phosphatase [Stenotrophomonas maltophilia]
MRWSILCDFDGTISQEDVIDSLLEKYGQPGWQALEEQWKSGAIGSRECMQGHVRLLKLDPATLDAHLDQVQIDPGFAAFVC